MITSLKNWRQLLFANPAIIGIAFDETRICAVQISLQKEAVSISAWAQIEYDNAALVPAIHTVLDQKKFVSRQVAGTLSDDLIQAIAINNTEPGWELLAAKALAQSDYPDLSRIALAVVGEGAMLLTCDNTYIKNYAQAIAATGKQLMALDWQPMAIMRIFYSIVSALTLYPALRYPLLAISHHFDILHLEALGAAINGLHYVEY